MVSRRVRAPNEGAKENKKWKTAKEFSHEDDEAYFVGKEMKADRERGRKDRNLLDLDHSWNEQASESGRGRGRDRGRGDFRGDRGGSRANREDRGDSGDRVDRGNRGDHGGFRSRGQGRGQRGEFRRRGRGPGSSDGPGVAANDESAFPSLGSKQPTTTTPRFLPCHWSPSEAKQHVRFHTNAPTCTSEEHNKWNEAQIVLRWRV